MLGIFKKLFSSTDNTALIEAIKNGAYLVDVRTPSEYASGSVSGAVNIPLDQVSRNIGKFKGKKSVVVFCRSGNRSSQAKRILEQNGIAHVLNGGTWLEVNATMNSLS